VNHSHSTHHLIMSIIKLLFKKNVIEEVVVPSPTTFYATAMKKFQDVVDASSIVPAMTNAKLVFTELSNTLIITTSNKVTTTVEYARDIASSIESRMQDYYYSSSSAAKVVVPLIKEQQKILLVLTVVLVALSFTILLIFLSNSISQKKKNESVRVIKKIHSMVTIDTTATSSSSSISNSSVNESSSTCTTQEEEDDDTPDNEDGVCFIDDDASCTSDIVRECIGEPTIVIPSIIINDTDDNSSSEELKPMIPSPFFHDIAEPSDDNGPLLESLKPTSPMRKLSKKLSSNKMFKMSVKKNNLGRSITVELKE
jgi:trehalose/maltose hydrolase-like predicted phosphorylase